MTSTQIILLVIAGFVFVTDVLVGLWARAQGGDKAMVGTIVLASAPFVSGVLVWLSLSGTIA